LGKVLGVIVGLIGMVGFGVCSLCGMVFVGSSHADATVVFLTVLGVVLTLLSVWLVVAMFRNARAVRERGRP
jgi:hypothetical protein